MSTKGRQSKNRPQQKSTQKAREGIAGWPERANRNSMVKVWTTADQAESKYWDDGQQSQAAPKEPIDELFDAATACVENGKVNRGCDGYAKLSAFVNQQRREPALVGKLVTQAEGKDAAKSCKLPSAPWLSRSCRTQARVLDFT